MFGVKRGVHWTLDFVFDISWRRSSSESVRALSGTFICISAKDFGTLPTPLLAEGESFE